MGKHSEKEQEIKRLNKIIALRDKEIFDIKTSLADVFQKIRTINENNDCSAPEIKRRRISEICTDTIYELLIDEIDKKEELDRLPHKSSSKIVYVKPLNQF